MKSSALRDRFSRLSAYRDSSPLPFVAGVTPTGVLAQVMLRLHGGAPGFQVNH